MRGKQKDLYGINDIMILTVSVCFLLLRLFIYFLYQSGENWTERYIMPLLKYREAFDFCSFVFFVITIYVFVTQNSRAPRVLFASVLLNFVNTIVCWYYVPGLWLKIKELYTWFFYKLHMSEGYVAGFGVFILFAVAFFSRRRWEGKLLQRMKRFRESSGKEGSFIYWLILIILGSFFLVQIIVAIEYSVGFKVTKIQKMLGSSLGELAIISAVSMVYICVQAIRKRTSGQSGMLPIIFLDVCLSLCGMASIRFYNGELVMSGKVFRNLLMAEVEMLIALMIIVVGVLLWNGVTKYLGSDRVIETFRQKDKRFWASICISGFTILFVSIVIIIAFVRWGEQIGGYFSNLNAQAESLKGVMGLWGMIVLFAVVGMIVLGGIFLFIYEVFQAVMKKNKRPSEWIVLLVSFVLTGLSLYIYYKFEPQGKMEDIAEDVAGVFAFPVVLMSWYVIMTGLLANISGFLKNPSRIREKLEKEMENLIFDSIRAIFAPLSFSANYLATLRDAVMEEPDEKSGSEEKRLQKYWEGGKKYYRNCTIWLKKYFKRGAFKR